MATQREPVARLTVERSRFFGLFAPLRSEGEIKALLVRRRKTVKRARHHCWASRLVDGDGLVVETAHNDGEVGKPGLRLLELLRRNDLCGVLVVSRVFGGVKLGPAGVGRAFKETGVLAVELYREG